MSADEDDNDTGEDCPLCCNPFDATDKHFRPCKCGYQICAWCWHQRECPPRPPASSNPRLPAWIPLFFFPQGAEEDARVLPPDRPTRDLTVRVPVFFAVMELAAKDDKVAQCPACRQDYDESSIVFDAPPPEVLAAEEQRKKKKGGAGGSGGDNETGASSGITIPAPNAAAIAAGKAAGADGGSRKHLFNVRVIQRNLVYVVGLNVQYCREDVLRRGDLFGRFGRIVKLQVSLPKPGDFQRQGSAYVTYHRGEDAARCIKGVDGTTLDGKVLRACFGTTKYCNAFLRYQQCSNPDCLYLHDMGSDNDSFTKEEMLARYGSKHAQSFHDATKIGANGVKTKILPAPANGSTQGRLGVTANGLPAPRIPIPFGGIAAPSNIAANDGGSSWAGKIAPGQQPPGTQSGFQPPAPRGFGSSGGAALALSSFPTLSSGGDLTSNGSAGSLSFGTGGGSDSGGFNALHGSMGNLLLGARDDDGGGWAEAKDGNKVEDEPPLARLFGSKPLNAAPSDGVLRRSSSGLSFGSGGDGGANGNTATAAAAAAAPKKEAESPKRRSRSGTGLFGAGKAPPPAPRLGTPVAAASAPRSSANWPPNGPQSTSANGPPVGSQSTNAAPVANAETSTRPAAAMFPDSLFNTSGGDFDPWSAMGGSGFSSLAGGGGAEAKSVATGVERQKSLGSIGGSRSRFGFVLDDGEGAVDEDTNTQTHTQTARASSTQVAGGALLSSGGGVLPKPRTTAPPPGFVGAGQDDGRRK